MPTPSTIPHEIATDELSVRLEEAFRRYLGSPRRVVGVDRRPAEYWSSHRVEPIDVQLDDGETFAVFFKQLGRQGLVEAAAAVKPAFLDNPLREITVYREILPDFPGSAPLCYGSHADSESGRYWLFLERLSAPMLSLLGAFSPWLETAGWLGRFHARLADRVPRYVDSGVLLVLDGDYHRTWLERARAAAAAGPAAAHDRRRLDWLAARHPRVVDALLSLPRTIVHGEFYPSNILVATEGGPVRVCPVDWEMAAVGPGLIDLAALATGRWTEAERCALLQAYRDALATAAGPMARASTAREMLDLARIQLAIQWLGWAQGWVAPPEHRHDWLGEAVSLAEGLGL